MSSHSGTPVYDTIGRGYQAHRVEDARIADRIVAALGGAGSVLNVGAGAGSYEPRDRRVVGVEPSRVMIEQRADDAAPVVRGVAGALPFDDDAFDATLAILTIHHWPDLAAGLRELRRVARDRVVLLTCEPGLPGFWLLDYLPEIGELDRAWMPTMETLDELVGPIEAIPVPVPHDCTDGMLGAYWRRPHAYLDPDVRGATSIFSKMASADAGLERLRSDLASGAWERRHAELLERDALDLGYRLVVARAA